MKKSLFPILILLSIVLSLSCGGGSAFADGTVTGTGKIDAITLLEMAGVDLFQQEIPYLQGLGVEYDARIPASSVSIHSLGEGRVSVIAAPYQRGEITWVPARVSKGEESVPFVLDERYVASLAADEEDSLSVTYTADLVVGRVELTTMANAAYTQALSFNRQQTEWDRVYDEQLAAYQAYQDYLTRKEAYDRYKAYESAYREWQAAYGRYQTYLANLEAYQAASDAYTAYLDALDRYGEDLIAYQNYQTELAAYTSDLTAYQEYLAKMERVGKQLSVLACITTMYTDLERSVYDAIMGDAVTTVLREYEVLTSNAVGVDKAIINAARSATVKLREWFGTYFAYETDAQKYGYYAANYEVLTSNWETLLGALEALYNNKKVSYFIRQQDKERKYLILLAELAVIGNALNDNPQHNYEGEVSYLSDWTVAKQTATQVMGEDILTDEDDATPFAVYPREVQQPTPPAVVEQPTRPAQVQQPTPPAVVTDPGQAPESVAQVSKPVKVAEAPEPVRRTLEEAQAALVALLGEGGLTRRTIEEDLTVPLETTFVKQVVAEPVTVRFEVEGREPLVVTTECGSFVEYAGEPPAKRSDVSADYEFDFWMDETGAPFSLDEVDRDVTLTPHFRRITKSYTITWVTPKGSTQTSQLYGSLVAFPSPPVKEREGNLTYTFEGWIAPNGRYLQESDVLLGDASFEAVFLSQPLVQVEGGAVEVTEDEDSVTVDCTMASSVEVDLHGIAALAEASYKGLQLKLAGVTVAVPHRAATEFASYRDATLNWYSLARNKYCTEYRLFAGDHQGALTVTVDTTLPEGAKLYEVGENGSLAEVAFVRTDEGITFSANPSSTYRYVVQYSINVLPAPLGVTLSVDRLVAYPEEEIILSVEVPMGVRLGAVKMSVGGEEREVSGRFVMPFGDVLVWAEAAPEVYTVTFMVDDTVLDVVQAGYLDVVTPPLIPDKASDDFYSYRSGGWDKEIVPVTGDAVYRVVYLTVPVVTLPVEEGVLGGKIRLIAGLVGGGVGLGLVAIVLAVILRKKRFRTSR